MGMSANLLLTWSWNRMPMVSPDEFRSLNRCLDNAIADAVTAYADGHNTSTSDQAKKVQKDASSLADEQRRLIVIAMQTYAAIKTGSVAINGATGKVLDRTLAELLNLVDQAQPATSTPPRAAQR